MEVFLAVAASRDVAEDVRRSYYEDFKTQLAGLGLSLRPDSDVAIIVVVTGGAENEILASARQYNVILAWPHYNSLPSALEASAALRDSGRYAKVITMSGPDQRLDERVVRALRLIDLIKSGTPRFGLVGAPNPWLVSSNMTLVTVDQIPLEESLSGLDARSGLEDARRLAAGASSSEFSDVQLAPMAAYAKRLAELAKKRGWDGLTLGCWCFDREAVRRLGWTPCISLALLNQMGVPAACEGDLRALYSMYVLSRLSGGPAWMGNVNVAEGDLLVLTHDGAPPMMAEEYSIVGRMLTKAPAAIRAKFPSGAAATLLRVSADLKKALLLKAVTVEADRVEACNSQVGFKLLAGSAKDIYEAGLGNHLAFVLDDVYEEAKEYLTHIGARVVP
ncbi:L-fucose isomerase and related protein-like protein [Thermoproteus uzoniensis 768-20]|uniref:L-fucose isomerase and related protein-like protein n=1 Tax=Thermoproteus uzoniensis (strain 768-20) TaxID=999630 RepID=F2L0S7_THEU7|nr:fucose isomerase [Thermoproteus uzoniensis]AEA12742.1 L-fucose isomerase and related protein-like protein [Thermoproteus uzoniensis 768-20]